MLLQIKSQWLCVQESKGGPAGAETPVCTLASLWLRDRKTEKKVFDFFQLSEQCQEKRSGLQQVPIARRRRMRFKQSEDAGPTASSPGASNSEVDSQPLTLDDLQEQHLEDLEKLWSSHRDEIAKLKADAERQLTNQRLRMEVEHAEKIATLKRMYEDDRKRMRRTQEGLFVSLRLCILPQAQWDKMHVALVLTY